MVFDTRNLCKRTSVVCFMCVVDNTRKRGLFCYLECEFSVFPQVITFSARVDKTNHIESQ